MHACTVCMHALYACLHCMHACTACMFTDMLKALDACIRASACTKSGRCMQLLPHMHAALGYDYKRRRYLSPDCLGGGTGKQPAEQKRRLKKREDVCASPSGMRSLLLLLSLQLEVLY